VQSTSAEVSEKPISATLTSVPPITCREGHMPRAAAYGQIQRFAKTGTGKPLTAVSLHVSARATMLSTEQDMIA
jgi:hypothetical protein